MSVRQHRYSKEEFAKRGDLIYQTQIRPQVEAKNYGKIVVLDIKTGGFLNCGIAQLIGDSSEVSISSRLKRHKFVYHALTIQCRRAFLQTDKPIEATSK